MGVQGPAVSRGGWIALVLAVPIALAIAWLIASFDGPNRASASERLQREIIQQKAAAEARAISCETELEHTRKIVDEALRDPCVDSCVKARTAR